MAPFHIASCYEYSDEVTINIYSCTMKKSKDTSKPSILIAFHKPYNCLSQFTRETADHITLADYLTGIDRDVYPIGRLDRDSEGLLLLTNDGKISHRILDPKHKFPKTYWAQVEGIPTDAAIKQLSTGVEIRIKKKAHHTRPCLAKVISAPKVEARNPPIRYRENIPTTWIELSITEGKNRQVRRMCAAVGYPVLRLIRVSIGDIKLEGIAHGKWKHITIK